MNIKHIVGITLPLFVVFLLLGINALMAAELVITKNPATDIPLETLYRNAGHSNKEKVLFEMTNSNPNFIPIRWELPKFGACLFDEEAPQSAKYLGLIKDYSITHKDGSQTTYKRLYPHNEEDKFVDVPAYGSVTLRLYTDSGFYYKNISEFYTNTDMYDTIYFAEYKLNVDNDRITCSKAYLESSTAIAQVTKINVYASPDTFFVRI